MFRKFLSSSEEKKTTGEEEEETNGSTAANVSENSWTFRYFSKLQSDNKFRVVVEVYLNFKTDQMSLKYFQKYKYFLHIKRYSEIAENTIFLRKVKCTQSLVRRRERKKRGKRA